GALAEVQPVVRTRDGFHEALEPLDAAEDAVDASEAAVARHARVVRVAAQTHLALLGHRHHLLQEVCNALPELVLADGAAFPGRVVLLGLVVDEGAVAGAAAAARRLGAHDAQDGEVILHRGDAGPRGVADHLANPVDLTVALRALA